MVGLLTGRHSTDAIWHDTEYANGGHELYDLARDPFRLKHLLRDPRQAERMRTLHRMLHRAVVGPAQVELP